MKAIDEITPRIKKKLAESGIDLYEIRFVPAGRNSVLKVFIDKEGGISIDDCEAASSEISTLLDVEGFSSATYRLEVSSPGADRPLKTEKDFLRVAGKTVKMTLKTPGADKKERTFTGTVSGVRAGNVQITTLRGTEDIPVSSVIRAVVEFSLK